MAMQSQPATQGLVVFAKHKRKVSAFYRRTLSLETVETQPSHDLLRRAGIELVIHAIPGGIAAGIDITSPPRVRGDTAFKPAFVVEDLDAVRRAAEETGGALKPVKDAWTIRGATVLDGWDPEGNVVPFKQIDGSLGDPE